MEKEMDRYVRLPEVIELTALGKDGIRKKMKQGTFPLAYKIGERAIAWKLSEIEEWMSSHEQITIN